jgi:lysyl endopeptidase
MKTKITLLVSFFISCFFGLYGQIVNVGQPKSWSFKNENLTLPTMNMSPFNPEIYRVEDSINDVHKIGPWRFGHKHETFFNLNNSGIWTELPNGNRIWRFKVKSKDALSINFIFEDFYLPTGAYLHIYKADKSAYLGAYSSINNNDAKILGTDLISGEEAIVELFEPHAVAGQSSLLITNVVHGYRDISMHENQVMKALNSSGNCNRDVKCLTNPEPIWVNESHSVAMIVVNGNGSCTGTLVNNTAQDGRPYFLTADHCLGNPATWAFRFKWIAPTPVCATTANTVDMPNNTQFQTLNGSTLRASNAGSDFALVEINNLTLATAQAWGLYYAGWDHTGSPVSSAIGIHHPSGDIMKYARENNNVLQATWQGAQTWHVQNWDEGVTEPGSSGSGLWNMQRRLIGQLYGGSAACSGTNDNNAPDYYGRFDVSWNGTSASNRLRDWLDPSGISTGTLDGWDPNEPSLALDAGIQSITAPTGIYCATGTIQPEVVLRNFGSTTLTSVVIEYSIDGGTPQVFNWTGSLAGNSTEVVLLPSMTTTDGAHTFTASTSNPNGSTDENLTNNGQTSTFTINLNGQTVDLELTVDCWGSETTWTIADENSTVLYSGGPYTDGTGGTTISQSFCLSAACYTFTINDTYGDGMYGSQYGSCSVDGNYIISQNGEILAQIIATNSDFGNQEVNTFCVESTSSVTANFETNSTLVCAESSVQFTDLSIGEITSWEWSFVGGSPATSTEANPTVVYNTPGVYDVTLTVSDGVNSSTHTLEGYITVNALPAAPVITSSNGETLCFGESTMLTSSYNEGNSWSNGSASSSIGVFESGNYSVSHTDANGCVSSLASIEIQIALPINLSVESSVSPSDCIAADGSITINGTNTENQNGSLHWFNGSPNAISDVQLPTTVSNLEGGVYQFTFYNSNGCASDTIFVTLEDPNAPVIPEIIMNGSIEFCEGGTVELSSSYSDNNVWSNGESGNSILVSTTGTYYVTYTDESGCSSSSNSIEITVHPTPEIPLVSTNGNTEFCSGNSVVLTSSYVNGNVWSTNETSNSITVSTSGDYFVTHTNGFGCQSTSESVTVVVNTADAAPSISASGATTVCQGETVVLTAQGSDGIIWSTGETTQSISVSSTGSYSLTYFNENGCSSQSNAIQVTVSALPTVNAGNDVTVCEGSAVILIGSGASSYSWNNDVTNGVSFTPTSTSVYTVTGIDANGCQNTDDVTVTVQVNPTVSVTDLGTVCINDEPIVLSVGVPSGGVYSGTGVQNNTFNPENAGVGTHTITYVVTNSFGCQGSDEFEVVVDGCASVDENNLISVAVYPNPVKELLMIQIEGEFTYQIMDVNGKLLIGGQSMNTTSLNTSSFATGMYMLTVQVENQTKTIRFVKE